MTILREIFRAYDIRGTYPDQLNEENAYLVGKALGTYFQSKSLKTIVLGRDVRLSSVSISDSIQKALLETGCDVVNVGIITQPQLYFLSHTFESYDAGVNITASHNPKQFSGIKINYKNSGPFLEQEYLKLYHTALKGEFTQGNGSIVQADIKESYKKYLTGLFKFTKKIKIIVDCGNGAASGLADKIIKNVGAQVTPLFCKYDGNFPNGAPDPENEESLKILIKSVKDEKADLGVKFDGDGDRIGIIDELGNHIKTDVLLMVFSKYMLAKNPNTTIVYDSKSSQIVEEVVNKYHGIPKMIRTGRTYVLEEIKKGGVMLASEFSGHVFFADRYFGYDDAIYACLRLLEILDQEDRSLSQLVAEFPKLYSTSELKVTCPDDKKFGIIEDIQKNIANFKEVASYTLLDGVRCKVTNTGWFLIRASNTSPYLSVRAEGGDIKEVEYLLTIVIKILSKYDSVDVTKIHI